MDLRRKRDFLLAAGILLLAGLLFLVFRPGEAGGWAVVMVDGIEAARYPLDQDLVVTIGEDSFNVLQISHGTAAVIEANCGDHTCMRMGAISREGESIICLPHHLIIRVTGGVPADFDASTG